MGLIGCFFELVVLTCLAAGIASSAAVVGSKLLLRSLFLFSFHSAATGSHIHVFPSFVTA